MSHYLFIELLNFVMISSDNKLGLFANSDVDPLNAIPRLGIKDHNLGFNCLHDWALSRGD